MSFVFISYAREDFKMANRLHNDLTRLGYSPWLDKKNLLGGQNWKAEISKAIKDSIAFIAVISKTSVSKAGFVQRELRYAFDVLRELPANQIYIVPVRLDAVVPEFSELRDLSWIDLFAGYASGLKEVERSLQGASRSRNVASKVLEPEGTAIHSFDESVREALKRLPSNSDLLAQDQPFYIRFATNERGVVLPAAERKAYPDDILIVLQYQYRKLKRSRMRFGVNLWFNGAETRVIVPYSAVLSIEGQGISLERNPKSD